MATQVYGNGADSSAGANTVKHFYDRAGINAANAVNVYGQFADKKSMPSKMGKTFKISKFLHMYDRALADADFASKGYMTARTATKVSADLAGSTLAEGAGAVNQRSIQKITMETSLARYGEMIEYTDEVELFSEDTIQTRYREELGAQANQKWEDLLQLDMLATPTVLYSGVGTSKATIGEDTAVDGTEDADWKVSYDLIRRSVRKLVRNRAKKNTSVVSGSIKIGSLPISASYYAVIGSDVKADLETLTRGTGYEREFTFKPVHQYAGATTLTEGEVGNMHDVRFVESEAAVVYAGEGALASGWVNDEVGNDVRFATEALANEEGTSATSAYVDYIGNLAFTTFADNAAAVAVRGVGALAGDYFDVHPILFPTMGAFATVGLKGQGKIKFNSKSPTDVDLTNPYATTGFFSYNFFYAGIILEEEKMLKTLVAVGQ
jgi:N4-gp56 family major capsid protein